MSEALVGRQPIFDRRLAVHGYELLFRDPGIDPEDSTSGDFATSKVILNTFTEIGLDTLVAGRKAFVNLTRGFIVGTHALPFTSEAVVLEVLESVLPEPEVLSGLGRLKHLGFTIALDDFVFHPGFEPLVRMADLVKLDVLGLDDGEIEARVEQLRPFGVELLAEKIETRDQFESCRALGFDLFQGFFLERPTLVRKRSIAPQALTLLSLLKELHSPGFTFLRAEEIVKHDLGLCYRLLRHINSTLYGMQRQITSVYEALVYLGIVNVQNLTSLFLLAANENTPRELITGAMLRARMCESLARSARLPDPGEFFVAGLFATLDALMEVPMDELLALLPLSAPQEAALRGDPGQMTDVLRTAVAYEHGNWERLDCLGLTLGEIKAAYVDALEWTRAVSETESGLAA